jgi:hypothetical protein
MQTHREARVESTLDSPTPAGTAHAPAHGFTVIGIVLVLASCTAEPQGAGWVTVRDTVGDTVIVRTVSGNAWGAAARLVADLTIGQPDGPDEYLIGRVASIAVGPNGDLYVFDSHVRALRQYAPDGRLIRSIGREGAGPGEFRAPDAGLAVLPDGRLLLRDPGNGRINVYADDGTPLTSWRLPGGLSTTRPLFTDTVGNAYTRFILDSDVAATDYRYGLRRYGPDGDTGTSLAAPVLAYETPTLVATRRFGDRVGHRTVTVPFTPGTSWTLSPLGYFVAGLSTRYAVDLLIGPDRVLRIERAEWEPVRVSDGERHEQERYWTAFLRDFEPGWRWNSDPIPDTKPPFSDIFVAREGRLWVQVPRPAYQRADAADLIREAEGNRFPARTWVEPVAFDVFESDGRYLGLVTTPRGFRTSPTPVISGDTIVAVEVDPMDIPQVVRYRVEFSSRE